MRSKGQRRRLSWLLSVVILVAMVTVACAAAKTPVEELREAVSTSMSAQSVRFSVVVSGVVGGENMHDAYEVSYLAPDRSRWLSNRPSSPVLERIVIERIVIGDRAWTRSERGWSDPAARQTPAEAGELFGVFARLLLVAAEDVSELGEGADVGEEGTTRYAVVIPDWGNIEADGLAALADKYPDLRGELQRVEETFRDVSARLEVIVGDDTKLIHFLRIDLDGPERQQTLELAFAFDTPVTIEPPTISR